MARSLSQAAVLTDALIERLRDTLDTRYRIERELGRGGMATVYLARDVKHDRLVAIKVLQPELSAELGAERFQREIRMLARLQHPHILTLYDSGSAGDSLYYVMPYVDGETLRERLARTGRLTVEESRRIACEVADALAYAHAHGVIHRDIKPENILLIGQQPVVADFGVARAIRRASGERLSLSTGERRVSEPGLTVGTASYVSPEQASGDHALDGRSDIFSLGCVLYEMLTGVAPFSGHSAQAVIAQRFVAPLPRVRHLLEGVPEVLDEVAARAMAPDPAERFQGAEELVAALRRASRYTAKPLSVHQFQAIRSNAFDSLRRVASRAARYLRDRAGRTHTGGRE